jgi:hypothetical protein
MTNGIQTPELDKLRKITHYSQKVGEFLAWLRRSGFVIAVRHNHVPACGPSYSRQNDRTTEHRGCGMRDGELYEAGYDIKTLLARFFGIDLTRVEAEKRALLEVIRKGDKP